MWAPEEMTKELAATIMLNLVENAEKAGIDEESLRKKFDAVCEEYTMAIFTLNAFKMLGAKKVRVGVDEDGTVKWFASEVVDKKEQ